MTAAEISGAERTQIASRYKKREIFWYKHLEEEMGFLFLSEINTVVFVAYFCAA